MAEGISKGGGGLAKGEEGDGVTSMRGWAVGAGEIVDVPRGGKPAMLKVAVTHFKGQIDKGGECWYQQ